MAGAWLALAFLVRFRYIEAQGLVAHCVASPGDWEGLPVRRRGGEPLPGVRSR